MSKKTFSPQIVLDFFLQLPDVKRIWVAFSGGMDSCVLLHALASISDRLEGKEVRAVHVDHGLNENSKQWSARCADTCQQYDVPLEILSVNAASGKGESPEAVARDARYAALAGIVAAGDCIATAHHEDDQAETLILQLVRGSGLPGLAAMASVAQFHAGLLVRPLLGCSREQLAAHAKAQALNWIDDPSNFNRDFDRNFLRHEVMPVLQQRWPTVATTISRSAQHIAEADSLLQDLANIDMHELQGAAKDRLALSGLLKLGETRRNNVIRAWIRKLGLPVPQAIHLHQLNRDVLQARPDAQPKVNWEGCEIRRYQDSLFAMSPMGQHDPGMKLSWDCHGALTLPGIGTLHITPVQGSGLKSALFSVTDSQPGRVVEVRFRQGGEQCKPAGREHTHDLKKLFQEFRVPSWQRDRIPLIYINDTLAAIAGYCYCDGFAAENDEAGLEVSLSLETSFSSNS